MLQKQHACIMQFIRIADSPIKEFINAYVKSIQTKFSCGRPRLVRTPAFEENILRTIEENPGTSCRRIALQKRLSLVEYFA